MLRKALACNDCTRLVCITSLCCKQAVHCSCKRYKLGEVRSAEPGKSSSISISAVWSSVVLALECRRPKVLKLEDWDP